MPGSSTTRYEVQHLSPLFRLEQELLDKLATGNKVAAIRLRSEKDLPNWNAYCTLRLAKDREMLVIHSTSGKGRAMLLWRVKFDAEAGDTLHLPGFRIRGPTDGAVRTYWSASADLESFSEEQAVSIHATGEGTCEIGEHPLWRGPIRALRFDIYPQGHVYEFGGATIRSGGSSRVTRDWTGEIKARLGRTWCTAVPMLGPNTYSARLRVPAGARLRGRTGCANASAHVRFRLGIALPNAEPTWLLNREADGGNDEWEPFEVDLAPFAGQEAELVLSGEVVRRGVRLHDPLLLWGNLRLLVPETDPKPDVVLVSLDALRRDHVGAYGHTPTLTPSLDRLAESAVVCERSITAGTQTLLSHASLFCGCTPDEHGVLRKDMRRPQRGIRPLADLLARSGYQTMASTDGAFMDVTFQGTGFNLFRQSQMYGSRMGQSPFQSEKDLVESLRTIALLLEEHEGERLLLLFHTYYVHDYIADCATGSSSPSLEQSCKMLSQLLDVRQQHFCFLSDESLETLRLCYARRVRRLDEAIGELTALLERHSRHEKALLVVFSDHGEAFGEHGGAVHGYSVHWELTDVPLIVKFPRGKFAGRRLAMATGLVDVVPTAMDVAGLALPEWATGRSLKELLTDHAVAATDRAVAATDRAVAATDRAMTSIAVAKEDVRALSTQTARTKYMYLCTQGLEKVYDLECDPLEHDNVLLSAPEKVDAEFLRRCRELTIERLRRPWGWHVMFRAAPGETLYGRLSFERQPLNLASFWLPGDFVWLSSNRLVLVFQFQFHDHREKALFFGTKGPFEACLKLNDQDFPADRLWMGPHGDHDQKLVGAGPLVLDEVRVPPGMPGASLPDDRAVVVWRVASPQEGEPPSAEAPPHVIAQLKALGYVD